MARDKITEYDSTAANNTVCGDVNIAENSALPSDLNNFAREIMSHLKEFADGTSGVDVLNLQDDDASASIKIQAPAAVTTTTTFTLPDGDGADGQALITDGSGTLVWAYPYGNRNLIINGAMQVAQRGTSNTSFTLGYAVDRMYLDQFSATGGTHTYQQLSSDPPVGFRNYLRWQRNSGETATGAMRIYYTGETGASEGIAGNKLTLSFYARAGADYSGGSLESRIVTGEGADQSRSGWANGLWTNQVNDSQNNTLTASWQRFTHTLASAAGNDVSQHALRFVWTPTGTAGADDYIEITGIQLEVGEQATPFEHRSYGDELERCRRYTQVFLGDQNYSELGGTGIAYSTTNVDVPIQLIPKMRSTPALTNSGNLQASNAASGFALTAISLVTQQSSTDVASLRGTTSGMTAGNPHRIESANNTTARVILSAEL